MEFTLIGKDVLQEKILFSLKSKPSLKGVGVGGGGEGGDGVEKRKIQSLFPDGTLLKSVGFTVG